MRKFLSVLLAMAMVLSLTVTSFAADTAADAKAEMAGKTVILHTNDVHGAVEGYAYIAQLKADYEAKGAEVILVDAGDFSQGTTYVSSTKGADAVTMMNAAGYDVVTLGNHEFDYGYAQLKENMSKAKFKVVCADVFNEDGTPIFDANYTYTTKSGVKVGFFGMETPETQTKANPALIKGLTFATGDAFTKAAADQVAALKDADVVICLAHLGVDAESAPYRSTDLYAAVKGIDFVVDGHSHTVMTKGEKGEPIQSTGTAFKNIGVIVIDDASKKIESNSLYEIKEDTAKDATVAAAAKVIVDRVNNEYGTKFATSKVELNGAKAPNGNRDVETNNGDLITDAMRWKVLQNKDGLTVNEDHVVAITNGGGIRAAIAKGDVTKKDINTVLPFGNTVAVVYVTGEQLLEALEASTFSTPTAVGGFPQVSGINFTIHTGKAYDKNDATYPESTYYGPKSIQRVTIETVGGEPFDANATYTIATNDFMAAGGDTYYAFAAASVNYDLGLSMDEVVMDYITDELKGTVTEEAYGQPAGRITVDQGLAFTDVAATSPYYDGIEWAVDEGITNGTTATTFSPYQNCTRAQIITYLWRAAGSPEPASTEPAYTDVTDTSLYFFKAVQWASEQGLVEGETFDPYAGCTRAMAVYFMWVAADSPEAAAASFTDVAADADYAAAVNWAVAQGVTLGTGDGSTFSPDTVCQRGQIVTFLYRAANAAA